MDIEVESPIIIVFEKDGKIQTHLYPGQMSYQDYGREIARLIRHVAKAFKVREIEVWESVDQERYNPTAPIRELKPN